MHYCVDQFANQTNVISLAGPVALCYARRGYESSRNKNLGLATNLFAKSVARALIERLNIHTLIMLCPIGFFSNQVDFKRN